MERTETFGISGPERVVRETAPTIPLMPAIGREALGADERDVLEGLGATVPEMRALPGAARPLALGPPAFIERRRRVLMTVLVTTYLFALVGVFVWGVSWPALAGFAVLCYLGMLAHEVVFHRFLAHKAFRTSRPFRFVLTAGAMAWPARGPIWWAATHRHHHRHADTDEDLHTPRHGRVHAIVGWLFAPRALAMSDGEVSDLTRDAEMRALERWFKLPFLLSIAAGYGAGWLVERWWPGTGMTAMQGLVWWGLLRALYPVLMMGMVNDFGHRAPYGTRRYATADDTRNLGALALLSAGASLHNNHHHYPHGAKSGFFPGEPDPSYLAIRLMEKLRLVWGVRDVPTDKLEEDRIDRGAEDLRAAA